MPGAASDGSKGEHGLDAVTPGAALATLYSSGVGTNQTKQHLTRGHSGSDGSKGEHGLDAVTPGAALGTLYSSGVGTNKTKQHSKPLSSPKA